MRTILAASAVAVTGVAVFACSSGEPSPFDLPIVDGGEGGVGVPGDADTRTTDSSNPASDSSSIARCTPPERVTTEAGTSCAPGGPSWNGCDADGGPGVRGYLYTCNDLDGGAATSPPVPGCTDYDTISDSLGSAKRVICPAAVCTRYSHQDFPLPDAGIPSGAYCRDPQRPRAHACPDYVWDSGATAPPGCDSVGNWYFGGSYGPLYCCP